MVVGRPYVDVVAHGCYKGCSRCDGVCVVSMEREAGVFVTVVEEVKRLDRQDRWRLMENVLVAVVNEAQCSSLQTAGGGQRLYG